MHRTSLFLLSVFFIVWTTSIPASVHHNNIFVSVSALTLEGDKNYYGTAILYKATKEKLYFITNAHLIPSEQKLPNLRMKFQMCSALITPEVIAINPGMDVAVLAIRIEEHCGAGTRKFQELIATDRFIDGMNLTAQIQKAAVLGVAGNVQSRILILNEKLWVDNIAEGINDPYFKLVFDKSKKSRNDFFYFIKQSELCPPVFLSRCLLVNFRSWGYSGGAFLISQGENEDYKIAGIVSYYSPLTPFTYVIPMEIAIGAANSMLEKRGNSREVYIELENSDHSLKFITAEKVEILNGPLKGKQVSAVQSIKPGGGDSKGGGGDSKGGGGDSKGGGGDSKGGGGDIDSPLFPIRGIDALLKMKLGIQISDTVYQQLNGKPITSLKSFLRLYAADPSDNLSKEMIRADVPNKLITTIIPNDFSSVGLHIFSIPGAPDKTKISPIFGAFWNRSLPSDFFQVKMAQFFGGIEPTLAFTCINEFTQIGNYSFSCAAQLFQKYGYSERHSFGVGTVVIQPSETVDGILPNSFDIKIVGVFKSSLDELKNDSQTSIEGWFFPNLIKP